MITSINNENIKKIASLNQHKYRKLYKMFLVEGEHLVNEAKKSGHLIETYTTDESSEGILVSETVMKKICTTVNVCRQVGVCKELTKCSITNRILILEDIQDPGNLGTLLRSAVAFGFNTVFLSEGCCDIYNPKVIRSSQGAIFKLNFHFGNIVEFIEKNKKTHKIFSTDVTCGIDCKHIDHTIRLGVILGNEGSGISKDVKNLGLPQIFINMHNTESLNVSIAGSIVMYELSN